LFPFINTHLHPYNSIKWEQKQINLELLIKFIYFLLFFHFGLTFKIKSAILEENEETDKKMPKEKK